MGAAFGSSAPARFRHGLKGLAGCSDGPKTQADEKRTAKEELYGKVGRVEARQ